MIAVLATLLCCGSAPVFDVHSFPLTSPDAIVFLACVDADSVADLFASDAGSLTVYPSASAYKPVSIPLPPGTSAFDIADVDGDGRGEVIAVCGDRIVMCPIPINGKTAAPRTLFELHSLLSEPRGNPVPVVLSVRRGAKTVLALPCETTLEVRTLEGATVTSYPTGPDAPRRVSYGRPFEFWSHDPPELGSRKALDIEVSRVLDYEPDLPPDLISFDAGPPSYRRGTPAQARDAADDDAMAWPWFPLTQARENARRVYYASSGAETLIRIAQTGPTKTPGEISPPGPERRYPGSPVVLENTEPDFNGDGNADLVLWSAPLPGVSLDALTQAATGADWPIRLTIHLFSPEKNSYGARTLARIERRIPVRWFFDMQNGTPLRDCALRDFDGDGKTDIAFCADDKTVLVWSSRQGLQGEPMQTISLPEPVIGIEFQEDVDSAGRTSLGVRSEHGIHFLHARP
ncbi:MAG: VCBS repeat-containing protein [Candidatus Hydrogenedentes bacterium]|nr:VCBS repeat-containing protein [Candidatus Hydrogenedentota bacterium]